MTVSWKVTFGYSEKAFSALAHSHSWIIAICQRRHAVTIYDCACGARKREWTDESGISHTELMGYEGGAANNCLEIDQNPDIRMDPLGDSDGKRLQFLLFAPSQDAKETLNGPLVLQRDDLDPNRGR